MDRSKALNTLIESTDLVRMLEEVMNMSPDRVAGTVAGMKLTLKGIRERILASHDILARELIANARPSASTAQTNSQGSNSGVTSEGTIRTLVQSHGDAPQSRDAEAAMQFKRSLRAQIEKAAEKI